jgi:hypothetical protein
VRAFLALVLALAAPQEDEVRRLLRGLDDDSIESRTSSAGALVRLGRPAVPALEKARLAASPELRERIEEVLRAIAEREKLAQFLPPPTTVTLKADDRPAAELIGRIARLGKTLVDVSAVPDAARAGVSLEQVPFWQALDGLCREAKLHLRLEDDRVVVEPGPPSAAPRRFQGPLGVSVLSLTLNSGGPFGAGERADHLNFNVRLCWEKGVKPHRVGLRLVELDDEGGASLLRQAEEYEPYQSLVVASNDVLGMSLDVGFPRSPALSSKKLARLRLDAEFDFILKYAGVSFPDPLTRGMSTQECPDFEVTLLRARRTPGLVLADIQLRYRRGDPSSAVAEGLRLRDRKGREHAGAIQDSSGAQGGVNWSVAFSIPDDAEPAELSIRIPSEIHRERIDLDAKDVPLR